MDTEKKRVYDVYFKVGMSERVVAIRLRKKLGKRKRVKEALNNRVGPNRFLRMARRKDLEGTGRGSSLIMELE